MKEGLKCVLFNEVLEGHKVRSYTWLNEAEASQIIRDGVATEYDPSKKLPKETPHRSKLESNGVKSLEELKSLSEEELMEFEGLGSKSVESILEWLETQ